MNGFVGVQSGKAEQPVWTRTAYGANKKLVLHVKHRCGSLSITTPVPHPANEFDVRSKLHGRVRLVAANQMLCRSCGYELLQNSKDPLKVCFKSVNIEWWLGSIIFHVIWTSMAMKPYIFVTFQERVWTPSSLLWIRAWRALWSACVVEREREREERERGHSQCTNWTNDVQTVESYIL